MGTTTPPPAEPAREVDLTRTLVEHIVRTGLGISTIVDLLLDALPEHAYPGEDNAAVLLDMLVGTLRPVVDGADPAVVRATIDFLQATLERTDHDLRAASRLARGRGRTRARARR
jgi:hypothetical protein